MSMLRLQVVVLFLMTMLFVSDVKTSHEPKAYGLLLVVNKGEQSLGIVDPTAGRQIATVPEGGITRHEVLASPGRLAYVPIYGNSGVGRPGTDGQNMVVIDLAAHKVFGNVDFGRGVRPHCVVYEPKHNLLYVTTEIENACDHRIGGGAVEEGTGFPSAVLGSINSMRVPSGSNRFACRFPLIPTLISM